MIVQYTYKYTQIIKVLILMGILLIGVLLLAFVTNDAQYGVAFVLLSTAFGVVITAFTVCEFHAKPEDYIANRILFVLCIVWIILVLVALCMTVFILE